MILLRQNMAAIGVIHIVVLSRFLMPSVTGDVCGDPPNVNNGKVQMDSETGNVSAFYSCDKGFVKVGEEIIVCLPSGKWVNATIKCVPVCPLPPIPSHAVIRKPRSQYLEEDFVFYDCRPGYRRLAGLGINKCLQGTWRKVTLKCAVSKKCRRPEDPQNGETFGSAFSVGKIVRYTCDPGFVLQGASEIKCLNNRTWSGGVPSCKAVDCGSLPDPVHGKKIKETKTTFHGRADFICKRGYSLIGKRSRLCQASGAWSGKQVVCKARCGDPGKPVGGRRIGKNFRHGKRVRFTCMESLKIQGPKRIICFDGVWSDKKPMCLPPSQVKDYSECGMRSKIRLSRMVGGVPSAHGMWPWQAGLYRLDEKTGILDQRGWLVDCSLSIARRPCLSGMVCLSVIVDILFHVSCQGQKEFLCGAALIERQWIITAAHCFMYRHTEEHVKRPLTSPPEMYKIMVGDSVRNKEENSQRAFFATKIIMHPEYHDDVKENDIALVKLSTKVTLTPHVRKVCLPESANSSTCCDSVTPGSQGFVAGWGATQVLSPGETVNSVHSSSTVLKYARFKIQDVELCRNSTNYYFNESLNFCAGGDKHGVGPCRGDSGGPFVMKIFQGSEWKWVAIGLVSWGEGCGIQGRYTFYTKLATYADWIKRHTRR